MIKKIIICLLLVSSYNSFSQLVSTISDVKVNGVSIPAGSPINLGTNSEVNVRYFFSVSKPSGYIIPSVSITYETYRNLGFSLSNLPTVNSVWENNSTEISGYVNHTINAQDIDFGEYNFLRANTTTANGSIYSNPIKIIKSPIYTGIFQNQVIPCNSHNVVIFELNSTSGFGIGEFQWNYGSSWTYSGSTQTGGIRLTPNTFPLGNISVVAKNHGIVNGTFYRTPDLEQYTSNAFISGSTTLCLGAPSTYTISGLGAGETFVWSLSNPANGTISNPNLSTISVSALQEGSQNLICTITSSCSQKNTKQITFFIGKPKPTNQTLTTSNTNVPINSESYFNISSAVSGATSYDWQIVKLENGSGCGCTTDSQGLISCPSGVVFPKFSGTNTSLTSTNTTNIGVNWGNCPGNYVVNCYARNDCEQVGIGNKVITVLNQNGGGGNLPCPTSLKIMSNPVKNVIITAKIVNQPCFTPIGLDPGQNRQKSLKENEVQIYNMFGSLVFSKTYNSDDIIVSEANLKSGKYILNVITANGERKRDIIIVE